MWVKQCLADGRQVGVKERPTQALQVKALKEIMKLLEVKEHLEEEKEDLEQRALSAECKCTMLMGVQRI